LRGGGGACVGEKRGGRLPARADGGKGFLIRVQKGAHFWATKGGDGEDDRKGPQRQNLWKGHKKRGPKVIEAKKKSDGESRKIVGVGKGKVQKKESPGGLTKRREALEQRAPFGGCLVRKHQRKEGKGAKRFAQGAPLGKARRRHKPIRGGEKCFWDGLTTRLRVEGGKTEVANVSSVGGSKKRLERYGGGE